jgi:copper chaperone
MRDENILVYSTRLIMALLLNVPSIACSGCGDTITKAIKTLESDAAVTVDVAAKTVTVESKASEESIKQAVLAIGHTIED